MNFSLLAAMMLATASAATPPGNFEAVAPGSADLRPVGPEELSDFTIGEQPSEAPAEQPAQTPPAAQPTTQPPAAQPPVSRPAPRPAAPPPAASSQPTPTQSAPIQQPQAPSAQPEGQPAAPPPATTLAPPPIDNVPPPTSRPLPGVAETQGISSWYWALAAVLAGLAGFAFLRVRQRRAAAAGGGEVDVTPDVAAPAPQPEAGPAPQPVAPQQRAPTSEPASDSVSIKMEPDLLLDLTPLRASLTDQEFMIDYALQIANRGNGPARKLGVDTAMVMAGPEQEQRIAQFIAHPPTDGSIAIETLNSYGQAQMRGTLRIPLANMTIIKLEDRQLILPTVVLYPRFTGGRGKPHRFVIGRKPSEGDKLAPMRADLGPRAWRDLEARKA